MSTNIATATRARDLARRIARGGAAGSLLSFMEFCGGHTHAISRYGLEDLLPANIRMIHGPGCPVCVLPIGRIDDAIRWRERPEVTLCTYGDLMRVPGSDGIEPAEGQSRRRRHPHGLFHARRHAHRRGRARTRGRVLRHRLRDHDAADRDGDSRRRRRRA